MTVAGPNFAGSCSNQTGIGSVAWANPSGASGSSLNQGLGGTAAGFTSAKSNLTSNWLVAVGFGFSIPSGATINGVTAFWSLFLDTVSTQTSKDNAARLVIAGSIQSTDRSLGSNYQKASSADFTFDSGHGGSTDTWGATLAYSDINGSTFGVALSSVTSASGATVYCNGIKIQVDYTAAGGSSFSSQQILLPSAGGWMHTWQQPRDFTRQINRDDFEFGGDTYRRRRGMKIFLPTGQGA